MHLASVILGPVQTEKSERLKARRVYVLRVADGATKIDVKKALKQFFSVDVTSVRVLRVPAKSRQLSQQRTMTKRHAGKRVLITLRSDSTSLDLAKFSLSPR